MEYRDIEATILEAMEKARTAEGHTILDRFEAIDAGEFASQIAIALPPTSDMIYDVLKKRVFNSMSEEKISEYIHNRVKELFALYLAQKTNKEQLSLLILLLIFAFKRKHRSSFTKQLIDVGEYFKSYLILNNEDLTEEVRINPIHAYTQEVGSYYIRVTPEFTFVPTSTTKEHFPNYLYNI